MIEIAAKTLAIDRVDLAEAEQCHRDVPPHAIDFGVERPTDEADARHRGCGLRQDPLRRLTGHKGFRTEDVGDKAGRDLWNVAGARG